MENSDIKLAWEALNRRLERQETFISSQLQERQLKKARYALWPLFIGQLVQMSVGIGFILLGVATWQPHADVPHVLLAGLSMHAYGILIAVLAGVMLGKMKSIDYAAPVAEIQRRLANLRLFYIRSGRLAGLPWWLLWVPFAMSVVAVVFNVDMYARMPMALNASLAFGLAGLFGTWLFQRWTQHPARARLRSKLDEAETGGSLRKARAMVDELAEFSKEE